MFLSLQYRLNNQILQQEQMLLQKEIVQKLQVKVLMQKVGIQQLLLTINMIKVNVILKITTIYMLILLEMVVQILEHVLMLTLLIGQVMLGMLEIYLLVAILKIMVKNQQLKNLLKIIYLLVGLVKKTLLAVQQELKFLVNMKIQ